MTALVALLLALQAEPQIEKVERLAGNVKRPLLWTPLKVTLSCAADFNGDVVAKSGFGFSVARGVRIKAGNREDVLLPALDPVQIVAGKTTYTMPGDFVRPSRIVLVDTGLPFASDLVSTNQILYQRIGPGDLDLLLPRGLLEAADLILVKEPRRGARVAASREEAETAVAALKDPPPSLEAVDRGIWTVAPQQGWVPAKKSWTLFFATTYLFAAFVALAVVARRFPRFGLACVGGVALLGLAGFGLFPLSQMWIVGQAVEVATAPDEAREHRVWFLQSAAELPAVRVAFPRLVKPIFPTMGGTDDAFTLRVDDRGCVVEGLTLRPGRPVCFGGVEDRAATKAGNEGGGGVLVRGGNVEGPLSRSPEFDAWKRFMGGDGRFAIMGRGDQAAALVGSSDLADEQERPRILIRRLP